MHTQNIANAQARDSMCRATRVPYLTLREAAVASAVADATANALDSKRYPILVHRAKRGGGGGGVAQKVRRQLQML